MGIHVLRFNQQIYLGRTTRPKMLFNLLNQASCDTPSPRTRQHSQMINQSPASIERTNNCPDNPFTSTFVIRLREQ